MGAKFSGGLILVGRVRGVRQSDHKRVEFDNAFLQKGMILYRDAQKTMILYRDAQKTMIEIGLSDLIYHSSQVALQNSLVRLSPSKTYGCDCT